MRFRFGELQLDDRKLTLSGPDGRIHVEPQVFDVLRLLIVHRDRVVSKEEILDAVWGDRFVSESALTSRIKAARRAVGDDGRGQRVIRTVHARGYQFVADVRTDAPAGAQTGVTSDGLRPRRALPRLRNAPIGRDGDIASVAARTAETPLMTITGPGGIGKTTLALAVGAHVQDTYDDGVVFVDLAPVPPGADVTRAVAEAAGLEGAASETIDRVADHLATRPVLVVLDNCEHVLAYAARLVDRMLDQTVTAHVLATSREPLGVPGEHVWPLGPLHGDGPALFVERARAAEPRVDWHPADPVVVELCRRLDDVPLALELAAGQLRRFDLGELLRRLDERLALPPGRATGDGERHATMDATIDWSYRLLGATEQALLRHLSVFPSLFDAAAVEASAPPMPGPDALTVFGQLVDKSLVVRLPGTRRYRLLEPVRMFARTRLVEAGEAPDAFERHRCHVRARIGSASRLDRWLSARLAAGFRTDLDDARQAFGLSLRQGDVADAVEIAVGASFLWRNAIGCAEGVDWVDGLVAEDLSPRDELWVRILRSDVGQGRGDHRQMFGAASAAGRLGGHVDDPAGACVASHYGALAHLTDTDRAREELAVPLELAHRSGDGRLVTLIGAFLAIADLSAGRVDDARTALTALERVASEDGYDRFIVHWAGWMVGLVELDAGAARRWMGGQQRYLDRTGIVETWITTFSTAMCDAIDGLDVRTVLARTLDLADREGYEADADCVLVLAYAALAAGRLEVAAELIGTAVQARFNSTAHHVVYRVVLDGPLRQRLDAGVMAEAMARGRARTPAEALAEAGITR
ncbi:MAG TPA: winged helix-turn-helix domain-containing protein [Acidimicrobiales bacterium]|nr:winged helix-turn-helix domain-containing protein [Acidimicrobiales bacterium]